jgi:nucleoside-diphosphate-sugar epimerase
MSAGRRIFVTGATGFIGTRLVAELARRGDRVRALARPGSDTRGLEQDGVELVRGELGDPESLRRGMEGCLEVYHLAACAKNWARHKETYRQENLEGTRAVLAAAQASMVHRVVYTSTIVTLGPTPPGTVGDETLPRITPHYFTHYEESKALAEEAAVESAARGLPVVITNPTRVYGPGRLTEGNAVTRMMDDYARGRLPVRLNGGRNVGNYVLVDDLVRGHLLAMENGRPGERYILGGENVSLARFFELLDQATGRSHRQVNLPPWAAMAFARWEECKARWLGLYPRVTPGWVETFLHDWAYSSAKAERELGYRITPLREGIARTCEWLERRRRESP